MKIYMAFEVLPASQFSDYYVHDPLSCFAKILKEKYPGSEFRIWWKHLRIELDQLVVVVDDELSNCLDDYVAIGWLKQVVYDQHQRS